jgi:hypothetical protein
LQILLVLDGHGSQFTPSRPNVRQWCASTLNWHSELAL